MPMKEGDGPMPVSVRAREPTDAALARRIERGDREAAAQLVRRYQAMVRSFLRRLTGRWDVADDLAQETLLRMLRSAGRYDPRYPMRTWLFTIARRLSINHGARARPLALDAACAIACGPDPAVRVQQRDQRDQMRTWIQEALLTVTEAQRTALVLYYQHDMSLQEVSAVMQMPEGTVKSHLHRGRAALRKVLEPRREMIES